MRGACAEKGSVCERHVRLSCEGPCICHGSMLPEGTCCTMHFFSQWLWAYLGLDL